MIFEVTGIKYNKQASRYDIPTRSSPSKDIVMGEDGKIYQIAFITGKDNEKRPIFGEIWFDAMRGGQIVLNRDNPSDRALYNYLMLTNWNESNPHRDESKIPVFKVLNNKKDAESEVAMKKIRLDAENRAFALSHKQVLGFAAHLGKDTTLDIGILRREVLEYAGKKPDAFLEADAMITSLSHYYVIARKGLKKNIIKIDGRNSEFKWSDGGKTGYKGFNEKNEEDNVRGFATWLKNEKLGNEVSTRIEAELSQIEE